MASLLVTGGAGFIGSNFVRHWRRRHPQDPIVVLDLLTYAGNRANLAGVAEVALVVGDIADEELVTRILARHDVDTIVHFAAESHVDRSLRGPDAFILTNVVGTHALLKAAKARWLDRGSGWPHRFHHVSTDEVFGSLGPEDPPFTEASRHAPNSPYAASKAASDHLVRAYRHSFGLQATTTNCSNNYGPRQFPEKLIPLFLTNALEGRALPIYGDGLHARDWLHVDDHCHAIALVLEHDRPSEAYNVGGGCELANMAVIDALCAGIDEAFAADPGLARRFPRAPASRGLPTAGLKRMVADRPGHDRRYAIDSSRIAAELGYAPRHGFAGSLRATIRWYLDEEAWWRAVLDGSYRGAPARGDEPFGDLMA
jgi:dTDP-glucose 4,6-dehydratase